MAKQQQINKWKEYYDNLPDPKKIEVRDSLLPLLGCSQAAFYRRLSYPDLLSISDKRTIATQLYVPVHFLFPELSTQVA